MALMANVTIDFVEVGPGTQSVLLGQFQANVPGQGQSQYAHIVGNAETLRLSDAVQVPGTPGSYTVANILTALQTAASDFAGATGTPLVTAAVLASLNGWNSGQP